MWIDFECARPQISVVRRSGGGEVSSLGGDALDRPQHDARIGGCFALEMAERPLGGDDDQ